MYIKHFCCTAKADLLNNRDRAARKVKCSSELFELVHAAFRFSQMQAELCSFSNGIRVKERQRAFPFEAIAEDATYRLQDFHSEGSVSTLV